MKRSIILFPHFDNSKTIQSVREKYDPLARLIAPHITLVFPFDSDISTDKLKSHLDDVLAGAIKFCVHLKDFTGDCKEGYLILNVKKGNDQIIELHDKLYSGILQRFQYRRVFYTPHLTVGRVQDLAAFDQAVNELSLNDDGFDAEIDKVYVENIDVNGNSVIEIAFDLA